MTSQLLVFQRSLKSNLFNLRFQFLNTFTSPSATSYSVMQSTEIYRNRDLSCRIGDDDDDEVHKGTYMEQNGGGVGGADADNSGYHNIIGLPRDTLILFADRNEDKILKSCIELSNSFGQANGQP